MARSFGLWGRVWLGGLVAAAGCDAGDRTEEASAEVARGGRAASEGAEGNAASPERPPDGADGQESSEPQAPVRVRFDLARHPERAELRRAGGVVADLGVPGGAKYTLGGWQTGIAGSHELDGRSVALVEGTTGRLFLPWASSQAAVLHLRGRAARGGGVTVHVNGEAVGTAELPTGELGSATLKVPAGVLTQGDNLVQLRARRGKMAGLGRAALALDWVALGPKGMELPAALPSVGEGAAQDVPSLRVPSGWSVGYTFEVEAGARLRAVSKAADGGRLTVTAHRDGGEPRALQTGAASEDGETLDIALDGLEGELVRLELAAEGGDVTLLHPAIVTPDETPEPRRPGEIRNVIVYLVDTLRADKLRPYNPDTRVKTPGFGRFAQSAALFELGHAPENWTKPTVASLLTSLMPWEHHATKGESVLPRSVTMISERLRDEGFVTGAFIANGYVSGKFGFRQGWDDWRNYIREGRRTPAEYVVKDVVEWLGKRDDDKPFFLYVQTIDPHVPYIPPDEVLALYDDEPYHGRVRFTRDRDLLGKIKVGSMKVGERDKQRLEALHDAEITYHDRHFVTLLEALEEQDLADDTMIVFTSDHGEEFFDHGSVGHGHSVWEELLHVPFAVRLPGLTDDGLRIPEPVSLVDAVPTMLEVLGLEASDQAQGQSLLPLLRGEGRTAARPVVSGFHDGWRAVVAGRLKLIQRTWQSGQLYDLHEDPGETEDLAEARLLAVRYLRGLMGLELARSEAAPSVDRPVKRHRAQKTDIDPATEAQLRALGYVEGRNTR